MRSGGETGAGFASRAVGDGRGVGVGSTCADATPRLALFPAVSSPSRRLSPNLIIAGAAVIPAARNAPLGEAAPAD